MIKDELKNENEKLVKLIGLLDDNNEELMDVIDMNLNELQDMLDYLKKHKKDSAWITTSFAMLTTLGRLIQLSSKITAYNTIVDYVCEY